MNILDKINKIKNLIQLLNAANKAYYQDAQEIMSNKEYDDLYDELLSLEKETGIVMANSPTHRVGCEVVSVLPKERHQTPMLSLDKTKSVTDLKSWIGDKIGFLSFKEDGLTCVLTYKDGVLEKAVTRGNGEIGELITSNARTIKNIPLEIPYRSELVIRGEAAITYSEFKRINDEIPDAESKYKNPRNLCSGSIRQLDSGITAQRNIKFVAFRIVTKADDIPTQYDAQLKFLNGLGFESVSGYRVCADNIELTVAMMEKQLETNDIPSDGLVLTYNDTEYGESLGTTDKSPKHSIAFKWKDDTYPTRLIDIDWTMGKTGVLTPTAVFESVDIDGTTVERASIHNVSILKNLKLGIGDEIEVYRSNMVIPQVYTNNTCSNSYEIPNKCPICGEEVNIVKDNDSEVLVCVNPNCKGKLLGRLSHFASRQAMNIDGLSEATINFLINIGWVSGYADLYELGQYKSKWIHLDGFGKKSVEKLLINIEKSKKCKLENFLYAINIPMIGRSQAKVLSKKFGGDWIEFEEAVSAGYDFSRLDGFGTILNKNIHDWYKDRFSGDGIDRLVQIIEIQKPAVGVTCDIKNLEGKTFCITGTLNHFANRNEAVAAIEAHNGKVVSSVTSKTYFLVNNEIDSKSSKNQKAKSLNIPIISEEQLLQMIE